VGGVGGWRCAVTGHKHAACGGWRSHATVRAAGGACRGLKAQGTRKGGTGKKLSKGRLRKLGFKQYGAGGRGCTAGLAGGRCSWASSQSLGAPLVAAE
jgi:hypothetical protein